MHFTRCRRERARLGDYFVRAGLALTWALLLSSLYLIDKAF